MAEWNGVKGFGVEVDGDGPPLLLLHGGSGRRQWFTGMTAQLTDRWRCIAIDLPGHGRSRWSSGQYTLADTAGAIGAVLARVVDEPVVVFGHSHGAHVTLPLLRDRPELVRAFVIGDAPMTRDRMRAHHEGNRSMTEQWLRLAGSGSAETISDALRTVPTAGPGSPALGEVFGPGHPYLTEMSRSLAAHDPDFLDAVLNRFDETYACLDPAVLQRAGQIPLGVLRADPAAGGLLTDADLAVICEQRPDCAVVALSGVGHGLQLQDPVGVAAAFESLMAKLGVPSGAL